MKHALVVLALMSTWAACSRAQANSVRPADATEQGQKSKLIRRFFPFDRIEWGLGLAQGGAESLDGHMIHDYTHRDLPRCQLCVEPNPFTRFFIGPRPSWPRLIAAGFAEDWLTTYLTHSMRRSHLRIVRWLAPVPQIALTVEHVKQGKNTPGDDCQPGFIEVNAWCYNPQFPYPSPTVQKVPMRGMAILDFALRSK